MYNNSEAHLNNLKVARKKAFQTKEKCTLCEKIFTKSGIKNHIKSCGSRTPCLVCGELKTHKQKTCSYSCSNKLFRTGENHGNWKVESYRTTCFLYHEKKCVICGEEKIVDVHHLDENRNNNKPDNLIPICPTHHRYWHSRFKGEVEGKVKEYIRDWRSGNVEGLEPSVNGSIPLSLTKNSGT